MSRRRPRLITITDQSHGLPYSKGLMAASLMVSGLPQSESFRIASRIEDTLTKQGVFELTSRELRDLAATLLAEAGEEFAKSYLRWQAVEELDMPLVILLGGATGVGKSTIATQLAARLGITRVISTDAIREVLRATFSPELIPVLYTSSFTADAALRRPPRSSADLLIVGFQEQVAAVSVGIKALIARALEERTDMIVEGAHLVPGFQEGWEAEFKDGVLVPIVIKVGNEGLHRSHFHMRTVEARPTERYLESFDKIRRIQTFITEHAERHGVPVLDSYDLDSTLQELAGIVTAKALATAQLHGRFEERSVADRAPARGGLPGEIPADKQKSRLRSWQTLGFRRRA
jgi:2-phosphoglycerate kinase